MPTFTATLGKLDGLSPQEAVGKIANHLRVIQEQLEYRLSCLDSSNITEINLAETGIRDVNGEKINNLLSDAAGNVSLLAQSVGEISATVAEQGKSLSQLTQGPESISAIVADLKKGYATTLRMTAEGIVVTSEGGEASIKGNQVALGENSVFNAVSQNASDAKSGLKQIADGTYTGGTFISGKNIYSPNIYGETLGLMYHDDDTNITYEVGKMTLKWTTTDAFDITSNFSLRLNAAKGKNIFFGTNGGAEGGAFMQINNTGADAPFFRVGNCYPSFATGYGCGYADPMTGGVQGVIDGQIYFKLT